MAVTIPASDVSNTQIQTQITALTALIAANPLTASSFTQLQQTLQLQLVTNLMNACCAGGGEGGASGSAAAHLNPATILSTCTVNT